MLMTEIIFVDRVNKWKLEKRITGIQNIQINKIINIFQNSHLVYWIFSEFLVFLKVRKTSECKVSIERLNF